MIIINQQALLSQENLVGKLIEKYQLILLVILIILSIFLRSYHAQNYGVGFDQVQVLSAAKQISKGKITLIGPRTGPASMFTGPLIYYLAVPFLLLFNEFPTVYLLPILISIVTGVILIILSRKYLSTWESIIITSIWAASPLIVNLDRVLWNPNLTFLSTILLFIPLIGNDTRNNTKLTKLFLFSGSFLSYQAHFSGFILIFLSVFTIFYLKRSPKLIYSIILGLFLSLLPTIIFDLRHDFLNFNGLKELLFNRGDGGANQSIFSILIKDLLFVLKLGGNILYSGRLKILKIILGFILVIYSIIKKGTSKLVSWWIIITVLVFSFYSGNKPEYYYGIIFPVFIYGFSKLLSSFPKSLVAVLLVSFLVLSTIKTINSQDSRNGVNVLNSKKTVDYIQNHDKPIKEIKYDMPFGTEIGLQYFLNTKLESTTDDTVIVHIVYGENQPKINGIKWFNDLGVWFEQDKY